MNALENGWIEPTISNRPTYSRQQYRLTKKADNIFWDGHKVPDYVKPSPDEKDDEIAIIAADGLF